MINREIYPLLYFSSAIFFAAAMLVLSWNALKSSFNAPEGAGNAASLAFLVALLLIVLISIYRVVILTRNLARP